MSATYVDEAKVDLLEVAALLHGDDADVVLLVDPHQELLVGGVEDAAAVRPVVVAAGRAQAARKNRPFRPELDDVER